MTSISSTALPCLLKTSLAWRWVVWLTMEPRSFRSSRWEATRVSDAHAPVCFNHAWHTVHQLRQQQQQQHIHTHTMTQQASLALTFNPRHCSFVAQTMTSQTRRPSSWHSPSTTTLGMTPSSTWLSSGSKCSSTSSKIISGTPAATSHLPTWRRYEFGGRIQLRV